MKITDDIKDKILQNVDIAELIGEAIDLKKRGVNYVGLCPFHNEKTPSFTVSPSKGIYKCFGCGVAGNAISFQMEYYRMGYPDAVKELAKKIGIVIEDKPLSKTQMKKLTQKDNALKALKLATEFYKKALNSTAGRVAKNYFLNRNFSKETIKEFDLGYAPDSWNSLMNRLQKKEIDEKTMLDAGLIIKKDSGSTYDRFRNRAMFTIRDHLGKIVGFGARTLEKNPETAKYINSPQSLVYDKSKILYGLFQGKDEIRKQEYAILTEGYADVLALSQAGFKNVVASSGTSLTKDQLETLYRYCKSICIIYDSDDAGQKAAEKALGIAVSQGFEVFVVKLPEGEDPDSLVNDIGTKGFQAYIENAEHFLDFLIGRRKEEGVLGTPAKKVAAIRELVKLISKVPDRLLHDEYIRKLASAFELSENQLKRIYQEKRVSERKSSEKREKTPLQPIGNKDAKPKADSQEMFESESENSSLDFEEILASEKILLKLAVSEESALTKMVEKYKLSSSDFTTKTAASIFSDLMNLRGKSDNFVRNLFDEEHLDKKERDFLTELALKEEKASDKWNEFSNVQNKTENEKLMRDSIVALKKKKINQEISRLKERMKDLSYEEQVSLLEEQQKLKKERNNIVI